MCWMLCKHFCEQAAVHRAVGLGGRTVLWCCLWPFCSSEQAVRKLLKDREHVLLKIGLSEKQWKPVKAEFDQVSAVHSDTKANLDCVEAQTFLEELKNRVRGQPAPFRFTDELWERLLNEQMCSLDTKILILTSFTHPHDVPQEFCQNSYS